MFTKTKISILGAPFHGYSKDLLNNSCILKEVLLQEIGSLSSILPRSKEGKQTRMSNGQNVVDEPVTDPLQSFKQKNFCRPYTL